MTLNVAGSEDVPEVIALLRQHGVADSVTRPVLFAISLPTIRAYRAIWFCDMGMMALMFFATPQEVRL